jgi:hypothetical protein
MSDSLVPDARATKMEISNSTSTVRTSASHGPDARISDMEIACRRIVVRTREALYGNYLQRTCDRPDAALKQERFSTEFSENPVVQLSVRTAKVHRPDVVRTKHCSRPFYTSAYK